MRHLPGAPRLWVCVLISAGLSFAACEKKTPPTLPPPDMTVPASPEAVGLPRVGKGIPPPTQLHRVEPIYTESAKKAGAQGMVYLEVILDAQGHVTHVQIVRSPSNELSQAASTAVRQWRYTPTIVDEKPVSVAMPVYVSFRLTGR